jgi:hypothetical protein
VLSGIGGSGTADYVARWQDEDTLTTGILYDNGSSVGVGTNSPSSIFTVSQSSLPVISTIEAGSNLDTFTNTDAGILRFRGPYTNSYTPIGDIKVRTNASAFRTDIVLMPRSTGGSLVEGLVVHGTVSDGAFVGIGTGTPSSKLHVVNPDTDATPTALLQNGSTGDASLHFNVSGRSYTIGIDNSDDDKFKIARNNGLGTTDRLTIDGGGNVGIGTTSPLTDLDVRNNIGVYGANSSTSGQIYLGSSDFTNSGYFNSAPGIGAIISTGDSQTNGLGFYTYTGASNDGKVGIGTASPTEKLEVAGNIIAKDSGFLAGTDGDKDGFVFHDLATGGGNYWGYKGFTSSSRLSIVTDGSERLTVISDGNVGIGTTNIDSKYF